MSTAQRPVEALARGLRILEVLSRSNGAMGNTQLARLANLPPSTVSRLTDSLVQLGYLRVNSESGAYYLTPKNLRLGYPVLANLPIGGRAYRALDRLTESTGMTSTLATRDDLHMAFVAVARGRSATGVPLAVGGRLPVSVSAAGLAYVRALQEPLRARVIASVCRDLSQRGYSADSFERKATDPPTDYVVAVGRWQEEIGGVATTVVAGGELYALTLVAHSRELEEPDISERLVPAMLEARETIAD